MIMMVLNGKPDELGISAANYWNLIDYDVDKITADYKKTKVIPGLFASFPSSKNPELLEKYPGKTIAIVMTEGGDYDWYKKWNDQKPRHRDEDYNQLKEEFENKVMELMYKRFPKMRGNVVFKETSTPVTTQYYINSPDGSSYGLSGNPKRFSNWREFAYETPLTNLYTCGQDISFFKLYYIFIINFFNLYLNRH